MADDAKPLTDSQRPFAGTAVNELPRVAILMCTYNGARYLQEQLDSFEDQTFPCWTLYVSDDASTDGTRDILVACQRRWGQERLVMFDGPCEGFAQNFISLLRRPELQGNYFAFSDQDDVWFSEKLERGLCRLEPLVARVPALYCSRTRLVDAERRLSGMGALFLRPPSFRNALVQSLAGANTMLINQAARSLLLQVPERAALIAHDWLAYLLVTGCGGTVIYDPEPSLDYRQHVGNLIGANAGTRDRLKRMYKLFSGRFAQWNTTNLAILRALEHLLTDDNRRVLNHFDYGRAQGVFRRLRSLRKAGVYRQTPQGNLSLFVAICLGKI